MDVFLKTQDISVKKFFTWRKLFVQSDLKFVLPKIKVS
jgi:hypothetical protein